MTIAVGVHTFNSSNFSGALVSPAITTQASGSRFLVFGFSKKTTPVITDSKGNTYTNLASQVFSSTFNASCSECVNGTGGASHTFTSTTVGSDNCSMFVVEITGSPTTGSSSALSNASSVGSAGPVSSPTITTIQANQFIVACIAGTGSAAPTADTGAGFSFIDTVATFLPGGSSSAAATSPGSYHDTQTTAGSGSVAGFTVAIPSNDFIITAAQGSYTLTGEAATLSQGNPAAFTLLASAGNYSLVGALSYADFQVEVDGGFYTLTGGVALLIPPAIIGVRHLGRIVLQPKYLSETIGVVFDFISGLLPGGVLSSASVTIGVYSGVDPNPSAMLAGAATVSGTQATQPLTGGVLGCIYSLTCQAVSSGSPVPLQLVAYYAVIPNLP